MNKRLSSGSEIIYLKIVRSLLGYTSCWSKAKSFKRWLYFEVNDTRPSPADQLILKENYLNLLNTIGQLNKREQEIINLFYIEDLSYEQITERLDISYANARTKLNRAKHKLRELLN